jgi:hypothetical protein
VHAGPGVARSKAYVFGRSLAGIVGSNPAGDFGFWVCCECCVLSGRVLCDGLITCPGESTECGVSECDHESSTMRRRGPTGGCCAAVKKNYIMRSLMICIFFMALRPNAGYGLLIHEVS